MTNSSLSDMKKCNWCGKEYPDESTLCDIDGRLLTSEPVAQDSSAVKVPQANERPTSVTIISWFLVITAVLGLFTCLISFNNTQVRELMSKSPVPFNVQIAISIVGLVNTFAAGVGMLKGRNWARVLYVTWAGLAHFYGWFTSPLKLATIPGVIFFLIVTFLLFRPTANQFFSTHSKKNLP